MALKCLFKLFLIKCIFEFMINTAPQGSNSVNGREKYFKTITFIWNIVQGSHGPVVRGSASCNGGSWDAGSHPGRGNLQFFFSFIVFLPFGLFLFIVTADPF